MKIRRRTGAVYFYHWAGVRKVLWGQSFGHDGPVLFFF
jgi:hypothetical protein